MDLLIPVPSSIVLSAGGVVLGCPLATAAGTAPFPRLRVGRDLDPYDRHRPIRHPSGIDPERDVEEIGRDRPDRRSGPARHAPRDPPRRNPVTPSPTGRLEVVFGQPVERALPLLDEG